MEYKPNVYSVAVDVDSEFYGAGSAQKKAFDEAKEFCESKGKTVSVQSVENTANSFGYTSSSLLFQCIERN